MNYESRRVSQHHEECLALLTPEQRETVLRETTKLLTRLRLANIDDYLAEWVKSQPQGNRIPKVERRKA